MRKVRKKKEKKQAWGELSCFLDDSDVGITPYNHTLPTKGFHFKVSCDYQDHNYPTIKCKYKGKCDCQHEINEHDIVNHPSLFKTEE